MLKCLKFFLGDGVDALYSIPWIVVDKTLNSERNETIWQNGIISADFYRFPFLITAAEAAQFFRLPIANKKIQAGFEINETGKTSKTYSDNLINSGDNQFRHS